MTPPDLQRLLNRPQNLLSGWLALTVLTAIVVGVSVGLSVSLLVLAGGALLLVIALFWWSLHSLTGSGALTLEEALSMAAPTAEEEQKRAVLRALKDLELEKSLGKISDEDYTNLSASYRQQAKDLIRALDANVDPLRAEIDELVAARLKASGDGSAPRKKRAKRKLDPEPAPSEPDAAESASDASSAPRQPAADLEEDSAPGTASTSDELSPAASSAQPSRVCPDCQVQNDVDARFCKRCGIALEATA